MHEERIRRYLAGNAIPGLGGPSSLGHVVPAGRRSVVVVDAAAVALGTGASLAALRCDRVEEELPAAPLALPEQQDPHSFRSEMQRISTDGQSLIFWSQVFW